MLKLKKIDKIKSNVTLIILFIIVDLFGLINLWNENLHRRFLHHLQSGTYNPNKIPWIKFPDTNLLQNEIDYLERVSEKNKIQCLNNISRIGSKMFGGNYSKKCSLYYDDFDGETKKQLDDIGNRIKTDFEQIVGKKLYLSESNFRCCILRYEGSDSEFNFHYDTEENNCYRTIFLFKKEGNISPFSYYDENGILIDKHLDVGKGLFFQGKKTYHGVKPTNDENSKRYIIGWQYSTDLSVKTKSLCSELRGGNIVKSIIDIVPLFVLSNILIFIWNTYGLNIKIKIKPIIILSIIVSLLSLFLPRKLPEMIGTHLNLKPSRLMIFLIICILSSLVSPVDSLILFNYILITEMFLPKSIIANTVRL